MHRHQHFFYLAAFACLFLILPAQHAAARTVNQGALTIQHAPTMSTGDESPCPEDAPIYYNGGCHSCVDMDGGDDKARAATMTYVSPSTGAIVDQYDKCVPGRRELVEYACQGYPEQVYTKTACPAEHSCFAGACRRQCDTDADCPGQHVCANNYCMNDFAEFLRWMRQAGYHSDFITTYRDAADAQPDWLEYWTRRFIVQKENLNTNALLEAFKSEPHLEIDVRFIVDQNAVMNGPFWSGDSRELFQAALNHTFGRSDDPPFFRVTTSIIELDYDQLYGCNDCSVEVEELPEPTEYPVPYSNTYDTIVHYNGPGLSWFANGSAYLEGPDESGHHDCKTDGMDIFIFPTIFDSQNRLVDFQTQGCFGSSECNVLCSFTPGANSARLIHELGHTLGLLHPYDNEGYIMVPDSLMVQSYPRYALGLVELFSPIEMYLMEPDRKYYSQPTTYGRANLFLQRLHILTRPLTKQRPPFLTGYETLDDVVQEYNADAAIREYRLFNEEDY